MNNGTPSQHREKPLIMGIDGSYPYLCGRAIERAGGELFLLPADIDDDFLEDVYRVSDGILLIGGGDIDADYYGVENFFTVNWNPRRDKIELALVEAAMRDGKPLLGICRGIQAMAVAAGGTLFQHVEGHWLPQSWFRIRNDAWPRGISVLRDEHPIQVAPDSRLRKILGDLVPKSGEIWVNSQHHQAVQTLVGGFKTSAWNDLIEAIEHDDGPWIGVQWHPEMMRLRNRKWTRLFRWLVKEAAKYRVDKMNL